MTGNVINDVYGGAFLKPDDLLAHGPGPFKMRISGWAIDKFEDSRTHEERRQIVLNLAKTDKRFGLNKTNAEAIAAWYGPNPDHWVNQIIRVQVENVRAFGEIKPALRVVLPQPGQGYMAQRQAQAPGPTQPPAGYDNAPMQQPAGPGDEPPPSRFESAFEPDDAPVPPSTSGVQIPDDDFEDDIPF